MINIVDVLIFKDNIFKHLFLLVIFSLNHFVQHKLTSFDLSIFIEIWNEEKVFEGCISSETAYIREMHLLLTDQLNNILFNIAESDKVLLKFSC